MTHREFLTGLVLFACAVAAPCAAGAADPVLKPLRTLTYDLEMTVGNTRQIHVDAIGTAGSGVSNTGAGYQTRGSVTIDIIAATADLGLVVDVSETAPNRSHPKVRIAVSGNGALSYDPKVAQNINEEEDTLVRWLARNFYAGPIDPPGTVWNLDVSAGIVKGIEHYRVTAVAAKTVTFDYKAESSARGAQSFDMTRTGTLVYDTARFAPTRASYQEVTRSSRIGKDDTANVSVDLKLTNDTLAIKN